MAEDRSDPNPEALECLRANTGLDGEIQIERLSGGRNNRIYRLADGRRTLLLKSYFHHPRDGRDRLKQEFEFLTYLWTHGVRTVPQPVCADFERRLGVYEYVAGRRVELDEISAAHIDAAVAFYCSINARRQSPLGRALSAASEACFTVADHLATVDRRVACLRNLPASSEVDAAAAYFVGGKLAPLWNRVRDRVAEEFARRGGLDRRLPESHRRLSPSDFGYHNALVEPSGAIRFLDFEYAGWDDPSKLVCDFANQPDMPLPPKLSARFEAAAVADAEDPEEIVKRIRWLGPVYQIKWSCIILNDFLPEGADRARFANGAADAANRKPAQLEKAERMLERALASFATACAT